MILPPWCEEALVFDLPMTVEFRGITRRQGMLLRGPAGWAEWSPFPEYDDGEAACWLAAAREYACQEPPPARRLAVPVNCTVPAVGPARAASLVAASGCATAKVKVAQRGQALADDVARVEAVRSAMGPAGRVRVDANGAWDVDEALRAVRELSRFDLEYVEQPCADVRDLARLRRELARRGIAVPVAADESIRRAADPLLVRRLAAADVAVIKVQPLGGVSAALTMVERIGLPAVVSSALESSIGLRAGVALAAALPELPYACGLNTAALLAADVVSTPLLAAGGQLPVLSRPIPAPDLPRADDEAAAWWHARLARVAVEEGRRARP